MIGAGAAWWLPAGRWISGVYAAMLTMKRKLAENLKRVRHRIEEACLRADRNPDHVQLVAVTKYATLDVIRGLIDVGVPILGENRVQELTKRAAMINEWTPGAGANRIEKLVLGRAGFGHVGQHRRPVIDRPGFVEYHGFGIKT